MKPGNSRVFQWEGRTIDLDAILAADDQIWAKNVGPLTRCLLRYIDALDFCGGGPATALPEVIDDLERIAEVLWPGRFGPDYFEMRLDIQARQAGYVRPRAPRGRGKEPIPRELRKAVFERDDYRCRHCGSRFELHADHIHPESKGGPMTLENMQTLCRDCNFRKGARLPE